ncbi:TPA: type VI secretion system tip protein TssI/VgrG, partial [Photobacterium damselae]
EHSKNTSYQRDIYDHYDYGVFHGDDNNTVSFTKIRLEALRSDAEQIEMISNVAPLLAGLKFELRDHNEPACNRDWTVVSVLHEGEQPQALEEMGGEGITRYHNRVKAIQGDKLWRPLPLVKPRVDGVTVATVVGPEGEEIYCDEFGRVKVSFPWDKYHGQDDKASCWIRVSQAWAGGQYGSMMLPRVGHEVLVSYVEGDIDRPI